MKNSLAENIVTWVIHKIQFLITRPFVTRELLIFRTTSFLLASIWQQVSRNFKGTTFNSMLDKKKVEANISVLAYSFIVYQGRFKLKDICKINLVDKLNILLWNAKHANSERRASCLISVSKG